MEKGTITGACGLCCSECPGYLATQANDADKIAEVAKQWSKDFEADIEPENVWCDGCLTEGERKCGHTSECEVRACVVDHKLDNCAGCGDYGCETVSKFFEFVPDAKKTLDAIRGDSGK